VTGGGDAGGEQDHDQGRLGSEVDRYAIGRLLGRGGMGAVYEARHTRLGRRVAIKFLLPELAARPEILRRFENEAVAAGGLEHPNLVAVIDVGRAADGSPYLVMEYLHGEDCARLLRRAGPLPAARAVSIVLQACRGVAVAHDAGIVHRDLKPENLFVTDAGDGSDQIKVLDFGIAKLQPAGGEASTRTGSTFGTTHYMSPEQARGAGEVDARTDVWSLGVVLYELLAGRKPFDSEQPLNVVHQILNATPRPLDELRPGLPRGLTAAIDKALRKDAGARFPSVRALASALAPLAGRSEATGPDAAATPTRPSPPTQERPRVRRRALGGAAGMALALGGIAVGAVSASILNGGGRAAGPAPAPPVPAPVSSAAPPVALPPAPVPAPLPAAPAGEVLSGQSGQSEQSDRTGRASRSGRTEQAERGGRGALAAPPGRRAPDAPAHRGARDAAAAAPASPARPALSLDPNPY
jgi:serine/threonine-protein kinase